MRPKYLLIAIIAFVAYVLGARAGEDRYKTIVKTATKYWNDPQTKKARAKASKLRAKAAKQAHKRAKKFAL